MTAETEAICPRDGQLTHLTCSTCRAVICPACLVRSPVGFKCETCGGAPGGRRRGGRRRRTSTIVIGVVALVVVAGAVVAVKAMTSEEAPSSEVAAPGSEGTQGDLGFGQEAKSGPFAVTVTRFACLGNQAGSRTAIGRFCAVYMAVRNDSTQPEIYASSIQLLVGEDGKRYVPGPQTGGPFQLVRLADGTLELPPSTRVNPGMTLRGMLLFDVPETFTATEFRFSSRPRALGVRFRLG